MQRSKDIKILMAPCFWRLVVSESFKQVYYAGLYYL